MLCHLTLFTIFFPFSLILAEVLLEAEVAKMTTSFAPENWQLMGEKDIEKRIIVVHENGGVWELKKHSHKEGINFVWLGADWGKMNSNEIL